MDNLPAKEDMLKDVNAYRALKNINKSEELDAFIDLLIKTVSQKMLGMFIGESIKTWDDYLKLRGEIVAYMYPIQEVRGAKAMEDALTKQLKEYYPNPYKEQ